MIAPRHHHQDQGSVRQDQGSVRAFARTDRSEGAHAQMQGLTPSGFTLIELLVVIGVIGILAGLILYLAAGAAEDNQRKAAQGLVEQVELAIEGYKDKMGYYPPDNDNDPSRPPLYYELVGTRVINSNDAHQTLDGDHTINAGDISASFGPDIVGFLNSQDQGETTEPKNFISDLKSSNIGSPAGSSVRFIVFPRAGPDGRFNPVHYDASSPDRHNPQTFDLWVELKIGNKTVTVGNW